MTTERLRSEWRFLAVREAFLDSASVPASTPIAGISVVKGSTTRLLDEGANDRSRRASVLDSCTGNSWNCTPNAEPCIQLTTALGIGWGRVHEAELDVQSLSRKTGGGRTRHPSTERPSTVPYRSRLCFNDEPVNEEKNKMGLLQEGTRREWTRRLDFDSAQVIDTQ